MTREQQEHPLGVPAGVKLPWESNYYGDIIDGDGAYVGWADEGFDASYIVTAANRYPEALALLERLLAFLDANRERVDMHLGDGGAVGREADAFLSSARTEGGE